MPYSLFIGCVINPMSSFVLIEKLDQCFFNADDFTLLASYCFLTISPQHTLLSFCISTVIQNVTHRASTKSPDRTPIGGTILGESILNAIPRLRKSGYFFLIIELLWNFALWLDLLNWCWFISFQYLGSWLCLFQARIDATTIPMC